MLDEAVPSFRYDVKAEGPWQLQLKKTNTHLGKKTHTVFFEVLPLWTAPVDQVLLFSAYQMRRSQFGVFSNPEERYNTKNCKCTIYIVFPFVNATKYTCPFREVPFSQERDWTTVAIKKQPKVKNLTNVHELFTKGLKPSLILDRARERHDMLWKPIIIKKNNQGA